MTADSFGICCFSLQIAQIYNYKPTNIAFDEKKVKFVD